MYELLTKREVKIWLGIGQILSLQVSKRPKEERGQYPAILTEQTWSLAIKDLLYGFWLDFSRMPRSTGKILNQSTPNPFYP